MKVLVTGATGFVGSHVLEALNENDVCEVIAGCRQPDRLITGFKGEVRVGDLRNPDYRKSVLQGIDVICYAAAWSSLYAHADESNKYFLKPTLAFLEEIKTSSVRRIIFPSTTSAAAPTESADALSRGIERSFWPHLTNVIRIENKLRELADTRLTIVNLRLGIFAGRRYALGLLPILVPRLKTHLVPWVNRGRTSLPIIDGRDIGHAFERAVLTEKLSGYEAFNITGPEIPTVRQVVEFLHDQYQLPLPHFSVPFSVAYYFAQLMEWLDAVVPWEPLVTRSIIHLMEEVGVDNSQAVERLGYQPQIPWQEAIRVQMQEMLISQGGPMSMARPILNNREVITGGS